MTITPRITADRRYPIEVILPDTSLVTPAVQVTGWVTGGILFPATFSGTSVSFLVPYGATLADYPLADFEDGATLFEVPVTVGATGIIVPIDFRRFAAFGQFKILSDVAQSGAVTLVVFTREIA